jgi:uncharacterized protein YegP (UPF0339 family)
MKFHIYQDKRGEWRWRLKARNGRIVADSGEGYARQGNAVRAAEMVRDALTFAYPATAIVLPSGALI